MITTFERGKIVGREEGRNEGRRAEAREMTILQLEARFGELSTQVRERVATLSAEQLRLLQIAIVKGSSLEDLGLTI